MEVKPLVIARRLAVCPQLLAPQGKGFLPHLKFLETWPSSHRPLPALSPPLSPVRLSRSPQRAAVSWTLIFVVGDVTPPAYRVYRTRSCCCLLASSSKDSAMVPHDIVLA